MNEYGEKMWASKDVNEPTGKNGYMLLKTDFEKIRKLYREQERTLIGLSVRVSELENKVGQKPLLKTRLLAVKVSRKGRK